MVAYVREFFHVRRVTMQYQQAIQMGKGGIGMPCKIVRSIIATVVLSIATVSAHTATRCTTSDLATVIGPGGIYR